MSTNISCKKLVPIVGCFLCLTAAVDANGQAAGYGTTSGQTPAMAQQKQMPSKNGSVGSYMESAVITTKVKAMLMKDEILRSLNIHVDTKQGAVTLTGTVKNMKESEHAVRIAAAVDGVKMVKNDLKIKNKD